MSPSCHFSKSFFLSRLYEKWSSSILKRPSYMSFPTQKALTCKCTWKREKGMWCAADGDRQQKSMVHL